MMGCERQIGVVSSIEQARRVESGRPLLEQQLRYLSAKGWTGRVEGGEGQQFDRKLHLPHLSLLELPGGNITRR